ncbi:RNA-binding protein [Cyclospora cayetanensis]|nr:RNA-binding protein [Cyclospora cayetanensis]
MDADGFKAVRRRKGPRKAEVMPYEGGGAVQDPATVAAGSLTHAGSAEMEQEASELLRRVEVADLDAATDEEDAEDAGEEAAMEVAEGSAEEASARLPATRGGAISADRKKGVKRAAAKGKDQQEQPFIRRLPVPQHRYTPLRQQWVDLIRPLIMHMRLQVRMNVKRRCVELRAAPPPTGAAAAAGAVAAKLQLGDDNARLGKGADYVRAFLLGFEQRDCVALLRLDDMYLETFEIQDVKRLTGAHFSR